MDEIDFLLNRGVDEIYPSKDELEKVLRSGKKLTLYQGFDPTGTKLHIGHAVGFRKLRQWQDLGHKVIFLIGDGTGQAGDPSGKKRNREKYFSTRELRQNGKDYLMQASKIVRFAGNNPIEIKYNGDWLNKLSLTEILDIAGHLTLQQMIERDLYQERLKSGTELSLREFLYPLLQGYDSVSMSVDLELGGSDQMFNMLIGRKLEKEMLGKDKFVMTVPLLADKNGNKIGKSEGNVIGLTDSPNDFFGKIMSLGDEAIIPCFTLLTDTKQEELTDINKKISEGVNPMVYKKRLAYELTKYLNDENSARDALNYFEQVHQEKKLTDVKIPEYSISNLSKNINLTDLLCLLKFSDSKAQAKRLISQNAVSLNGEKINADKSLIIKNGDILKSGKTNFVKFV